MSIITITKNSQVTGGLVKGTASSDLITVFSAVSVNLTIDGLGGGDAIYAGGSGVDSVVYYASDLLYVGDIGGSGTDILDIKGSGQTVNLSGSTKHSGPVVTGFDELDLTNGGTDVSTAASHNTLIIDGQGVDNFTEKTNSITHTADTMIVNLGEYDVVQMGSGWVEGASKVIGAIHYDVYTDVISEGKSTETVTLYVEFRNPIAQTDTLSTTIDNPSYSVNLLTQDPTLLFDPNGDPLHFSMVNGAAIAASGATAFTTALGFHGTITAAGLVTLNTTGPNLNAYDAVVGSTLHDSFTYQVADGFGGVSNTATITVNETVIDEPFAVTTASGVVLTSTAPSAVVASSTAPNDAPAGSLPILDVVLAPADGALSINAQGQVVYTANYSNPAISALNVGQTAHDTFTFELLTPGEKLGGTAEATHTETVTINGAATGVPMASTSALAPFGTVTVGNPKTETETITNTGTGTLNVSSVAVPAGFSDTFTAISLTHGQSETFNVTFAPTANGLDSGNLVFTDNSGNGVNVTQSVALSGTGYAPVATAATENINLDSAAQTFNIASLVADPNSDPLTFTTATGASFVTAQGFSGTISAAGAVSINTLGPNAAEYNAAPGSTISDSFAYKVTDPYGNVSTNTITINEKVIDEPFAVTPATGIVLTSGAPSAVAATFVAPNDAPAGSLPILDIVSGPAFGSLSENAMGQPVYTANYSNATIAALNAGQTVTDSFTFELLTPGEVAGATAETSYHETVTIDGTGAPVASASAITPFGTVTVGNSMTETETITNTGSGILNVTSVAVPAGYSDSFTAASLAHGQSETFNVTFAPTAAGLDSGNLVFTDNAGNVVGATQLEALSGTGFIPVATAATENINLDSAAQTFNIASLVADPNSDPLTFTTPSGASFVTAQGFSGTISAAGAVSIDTLGANAAEYSAAPGSTISDSFAYKVTDPYGNVSTNTITINEKVIDEPFAVTPASGVVLTSGAPSAVAATFVAPNDAPAGSLPILDIVSAPAYGSLSENALGQPVYTANYSNATIAALNAGQTVTDSFTFELLTPGEVAGATAETSYHETVTIDGAGASVASASAITPFGTVTVGNPQTETETITNTGSGILNVTSVAVPAGYSDNFTAVSLAHGQSETFNVTFAPTAAGLDSGNLVFTDNSGNVVGATQLEALSGTGFIPVATAATENINLDSAAQTFNIASLVADPNSDPLTFTTATGASFVTAQGFSGTISAAGVVSIDTLGPNAAEYDAAPGSTIPDSFAYKVTDPYGNVSNTATITLNETVIDEPFAVTPASGIVLTSGAPSAVAATFVAPNDAPAGSLPILDIVSGPAYGSLSENALGQPVYTANYTNAAIAALNAGQTITDSFTIELLTPGEVAGATAETSYHETVTIDGAGAPVASASAIAPFGTVTVGNPQTETETITNTGTGMLNVTSVAVPAGFSDSFTAVSLAHGQSETFNVTFAPTAAGLDSGNLVFTDNSGNVVGATQMEALSGTGFIPVATAATENINLDSAAQTFNIASLVADPNSDPLTFTTPSGASFVTAQGFSGTISAAGVVSIDTLGPNAAEYDAAPGSTIPDSFAYKVTDPYGNISNTATITLNETVIDEPFAVTPASGIVLTSGAPSAVAATFVAPNDAPAGSLPSLDIISGPAFGSLTENALGQPVYTANYSNATIAALNVGQTQTDSFTFELLTPGEIAGATAETSYHETVTIDGAGVPVASVAISQPSFGPIVDGQSETIAETFTITNISATGTLDVTGVSSLPAGYSISNLASFVPLELAPGQMGTETLDVVFNPTAVQSYNGNIVLTDNDTNAADSSVAITGSGTSSTANQDGRLGDLFAIDGTEPGVTPSVVSRSYDSIDGINNDLYGIIVHTQYTNPNPGTLDVAAETELEGYVAGHQSNVYIELSYGPIQALENLSLGISYGGDTILNTGTAHDGQVQFAYIQDTTSNNNVGAIELNGSTQDMVSVNDYNIATDTQQHEVLIRADQLTAAGIALLDNHLNAIEHIFVTIAPIASLSVPSLNFGDEALGQSKTMQVTVSNNGTGNLDITGVTAPAGYTVVPDGSAGFGSGVNIAAGASQLFDVTFAPGATGSYNGNLVFTDDDTTLADSTLALTGASDFVTVVGAGIPAQTIAENAPLDILAAQYFNEPVAGDSLTFSLEGQPSWMHINSATGEITGTPRST